MDLQPLDIKLITTIYKHSSITFSELNKIRTFSNTLSLTYQLNKLYDYGYVSFVSEFGNNGYIPSPSSPVTLTDKGINIVQTCKYTKHINLRTFIVYQLIAFALAITADNIDNIVSFITLLFSN